MGRMGETKVGDDGEPRWASPSPSTNRMSRNSPRSSDRRRLSPRRGESFSWRVALPLRSNLKDRAKGASPGAWPFPVILTWRHQRISRSPAAPVLSLSGVSKTFPGRRALHDVSFDLRAGEVTALIGENGAGKSTLVKILTGIYAPDAGRVFVDGRRELSLARATPGPPASAAIHQETVMFDELSVAENIFMGHMPGGRLIDWGEMRRARRPARAARRRLRRRNAAEATLRRAEAPGRDRAGPVP